MADPLTIAGIGWAVSPAIGLVLNKAYDFLKKPVKRTQGIEDDMVKLQHMLPAIRSVVSAAETRKIDDPHLHAYLLRQMKEAVYDAEDAMDEFDYSVQAEKFGVVVKSSEKKKKKSKDGMVEKGKRLLGVDDLQNSLSKAIKRLEQVERTADAFIRASNLQGTAHEGPRQTPMAPDRETTSLSHEKDIVRRDACEEKIVQNILEHASCGSRTPLVIPFVGEGGIGKTTLAQSIYKHTKMAAFDERIWVCVANYFDEVMVTKQVLAEVKHQDFERASLHNVQKRLIESLGNKTFLLILDDVWVEDENDAVKNREKWKKFISIFEQCRGGSSIVVTTRLKAVVKMVGTTDENAVNLEGLSEEESKSLFMSHAFKNSVTRSPELVAIGEKIVEKLNGSPLALKVVGMQLSEKNSVRDWEYVLENTKSAARDVLVVLKLSYDHLPSHLKPCFAFCSLFPKGHYFTEGHQVDHLIHMWIALGFVQSDNEPGCNLDKIGQRYFDDLCSRSLFQTIEAQRGTSFVMHDILHDLAQSVSREECCQIQNDQTPIPSTARYISIPIDHFPLLEKIPNPYKLRTVIVLNPSKVRKCFPEGDKILKAFKGVRVLDLAECCSENLPKAIKRMVHLRYIACGPTSMLLPEDCSELFNLQVLSMSCPRSTSLDWFASKNLSRLNNLRHVYIWDLNSIETEPQFLGDHPKNRQKVADKVKPRAESLVQNRKNEPAVLIYAKDLEIANFVDGKWRFNDIQGDQRFTVEAELLEVWWLSIKAKLHLNQLGLSRNQETYAAHLIFRIKENSEGLDNSFQEACVSAGVVDWTKVVCVKPSAEVLNSPNPILGLPVESDGWMELELGQFSSDSSYETVKVRFKEIDCWNRKSGLVVAGIEIRPVN